MYKLLVNKTFDLINKKILLSKLKYGLSRCFSPGSFAVLSGAAPPPWPPESPDYFAESGAEV